MNEKVMIQVHENIKKYRKLNNMTQEKLAAALEMDPRTTPSWSGENGISPWKRL